MEKLVIEIETYSKEGKAVPKGQKYVIRIDRENYTVENESMTGRELLILAKKVPVEKFQLNQRNKGGKVVKIDYDQAVDFTAPGIEKFMTIPLDQTEGGK